MICLCFMFFHLLLFDFYDSLLHGHHNQPPIRIVKVSVAGNQREDMIVFVYFDPRIIKGRGLGTFDKAQKTLVTVKGCRGSVPIAAANIYYGENGILAQVIEGIEVKRFVCFVETFLFVGHKWLEHIAAVCGDVMPIHGDIPAGGLVIRFPKGKERSDFALFPGKSVGQVVIHTVSPYHGIVDLRAGYFQPRHKITILSFAGFQINSGFPDCIHRGSR